MNRENSSNVIRVIAGGYLLYLAYQMFQSLRAGEVEKPGWIIAATVFFVISGAGILAFGIKEMIEQSKMNDEEAAEAALNEELEMEEEVYGTDVEPALKEGKLENLNKELEKLNAGEANGDIDRPTLK